MLNVRLASDYLYGKLLFTWLSLVMSLLASFCGVLFPMRCLGRDLSQFLRVFLPTLLYSNVLFFLFALQFTSQKGKIDDVCVICFPYGLRGCCFCPMNHSGC